MYKISIAAVFACLMLCSAAARADETPRGTVFPIPRYEAEQVVAGWLRHAAYTVSTTEGEDSVLLTGTQDSRTLKVLLKHHSPLSTEISMPGGTAPGDADALVKYLNGYVQESPSAHQDKKGAAEGRHNPYSGDLKTKIPEPVLNKADSVVCIRALDTDSPAQLTGYIVDRGGLIICTAHTLKKPQVLAIYLMNGLRVEGKIIKEDEKKDLALIDCSHHFPDVVPLTSAAAAPVTGQKVYAMGYPLDHGSKVLTGFVSGPPRSLDGQPLIQVRMVVEPGSSGSPVFDAAGNLVGMVRGRLRGDNHSGLLIPLETIITFIKER